MMWRTAILRCKVSTNGGAGWLPHGPLGAPANFEPAKEAYQSKGTPFIDRVRLTVFGGAGGTGYPRIHGIGGDGGAVYIEARENTKLEDLIKTYPDRKVKGRPGGHSSPAKLLGQTGADVSVEVPPGVLVTDENNRAIADLVKPGQRFCVARGGVGGNPKNAFCGRKGTHAIITLYLKLIADIGFVGFPNAGKSTLLRALSRARPKVANYPFTTLRPNVGEMEYPDFRRITLADLPGLIEGAHKNCGLGYNFLRHVERTSLLMFVVDIQGFQLNEKNPFRNAFETVMSLNKELEMYQASLLRKPAVLVINKMDTEGATEKAEQLAEAMASQEAFDQLPDELRPSNKIHFKDTIHIVARDMENVQILKDKLRTHLDDIYEDERTTKDAQRPPTGVPPLVDQLV